jgi:hypothetical protein
LFSQLPERIDVMVGELCAGFFSEDSPGVIRRDLCPLFLDHLEEQEIRELLYVVAVIDAVVSEGVAESPEFSNDVGHELPLNLDRIIRINLEDQSPPSPILFNHGNYVSNAKAMKRRRP